MVEVANTSIYATEFQVNIFNLFNECVNSEVKKDSQPLKNFAIATHQTMICKVSKYFEFKKFRFSITSRHPLSVRKAEILEFLRIRESLNVLYRFKINVEFRTCFTGSTPYIGNIQMAPLKLKKL